MPAVSLKPLFIYGLNSQSKQNVSFISKDQIIYPAGGVLVLQELNETHQQTYIHLHDKQRPLNVMAISPKKNLVATGEGGGQPIVSLYSVTQRCYLCSMPVPGELRAQNLACLQFTCDGQFVIAVTGAPDWMLLCYNVATRVLDSKTRANMAAQPTGEVTQVACNPGDPTTLAVVGPGLFRLLQLVDGSWRQFGFYKAQLFPLRSACWLTSDRLLAGTEDGRLLLIESNELKAVFVASGLTLVTLPTKDTPVEENIPGPADQCVNAIVAHANGFLLGLGNPCEVAVYRHEQGPNYPHFGTIQLRPLPVRQDDTDTKAEEEANAVWWLDVSPDCNMLLASTVQVQLYTARLDVETPGFLEPLGEPLHRGAVVGTSMCVWRPIFATCGVYDRSVRLWNYSTGRQELAKTFSSQPLCLSLHPLGLFVLVGFAHSVCLLAVQLEELATVRELAVRNCRICKFSPGGQLFAVAHGNRVQIVSAVTFAILQSLQGHCAQVEGLSWSQDDTRLVTCGADGAVYEWEVASGKRLEEVVNKGTFYQAVSTFGRNNYVVAGDTVVREISRSQLVNMVPCKSKTELQLVVVLMRNERTLLVASRCGTVLSVALPLGETEAVTAGMCMHSACVNMLAVSHDGSTVVSCAEDGSVCVWRLGEIKKEIVHSSVEQVLVGRSQLSNLTHLAAALANRLSSQHEEQKAALEHQARALEQRLAIVEEQHKEKIIQLEEQMQEAALQQSRELERTRVEAITAREQHESARAALEDSYQMKLLAEYKRVEALEQQLTEKQKESENTLSTVKRDYEQTITHIRHELNTKIRDLEETVNELRRDAVRNAEVHEEAVRQIEHDADKEVVQIKVRHERELREERECVEQLGAEIQSARKKVQGSQQEIQDLQHQRQQLHDEMSQLRANIASLEQYIEQQRKLMERNITILEVKERDLSEVRHQLSEMGKEQETLMFRMQLLAKNIEPKDQAIKEKTHDLEQMGRELRVERNQRAQIEVELASTAAQLKQMQRNVLAANTRERDAHRDLERLRARVHQLGEVLQQPKNLARVAAELYRDYGRDGGSTDESEHPTEVLLELKRQMETLQDLNHSLMRKLRTSEEQHRTEKNALKQECVYLMKEIAAIRSKNFN